MRIFSYIILIIIVVLGITFAALNAQPVNLDYYIGTRTISLSLLLALCLGVGILIGLLIAFFPLLKLKRVNYQLRKQVKNT